jgi:hypothetical protein
MIAAINVSSMANRLFFNGLLFDPEVVQNTSYNELLITQSSSAFSVSCGICAAAVAAAIIVAPTAANPNPRNCRWETDRSLFSSVIV